MNRSPFAPLFIGRTIVVLCFFFFFFLSFGVKMCDAKHSCPLVCVQTRKFGLGEIS